MILILINSSFFVLESICIASIKESMWSLELLKVHSCEVLNKNANIISRELYLQSHISTNKAKLSMS